MDSNISSKEVSRHMCLIYDGHPSEQLPVVVPFLANGLQNHWRCLYLGSPEMVRMAESSLGEHGINTTSEMKRGALIFSSERDHLNHGSFDARAMVASLREFIDLAVQDGFEGLCATGDMRWELGTDANFDELVKYEALLEQLFREKPLLGLCQYHRDVLPPRTLKEALVTHRSTYIGEAFNRDNPFYTPPEILLDDRDVTQSTKQGQWMCQQLLRVVKAEQARDKALLALEEVTCDLEHRVKERTMQLEVANQELEACSYSLSHALRSPLRAIKESSAWLMGEADLRPNPESRTYLDCVRSGVRQMEGLLDRLPIMVHIARVDLQRTSVDLSAIAKEVERDLRESDPNRAVEFAIAEGMHASGDRVLLRCMLANLMRNAWKFTAGSNFARIEIGKMRPETGGAVFFVKDNGAGFEVEDADSLFESFEDSQFCGSGLGLTAVRRIVEKHGGHVWAEGRPDQGATFFFTLSECVMHPESSQSLDAGRVSDEVRRI